MGPPYHKNKSKKIKRINVEKRGLGRRRTKSMWMIRERWREVRSRYTRLRCTDQIARNRNYELETERGEEGELVASHGPADNLDPPYITKGPLPENPPNHHHRTHTHVMGFRLHRPSHACTSTSSHTPPRNQTSSVHLTSQEDDGHIIRSLIPFAWEDVMLSTAAVV